ncbi:unnamed protein product [Ilex paraguariensis]|uniref:Uncharacterized protein n=1 Tax=Ilex paraguariensis TaxID=185542 RepID=A0ABC8US35_9AQUA
MWSSLLFTLDSSPEHFLSALASDNQLPSRVRSNDLSESTREDNSSIFLTGSLMFDFALTYLLLLQLNLANENNGMDERLQKKKKCKKRDPQGQRRCQKKGKIIPQPTMESTRGLLRNAKPVYLKDVSLGKDA